MLLVTQLHCLPSLHNSVNGVVYYQFRNTVWSPFVGTLLTLIIDECLLNRTILFQAKGCGALHVIQNTACLPICSTKFLTVEVFQIMVLHMLLVQIIKQNDECWHVP